jgi:hypothetical protein
LTDIRQRTDGGAGALADGLADGLAFGEVGVAPDPLAA